MVTTGQSCPLTSEENMVAQVPMHQHTTGFVILPRWMASQILYSSVPPICRTQSDGQRQTKAAGIRGLTVAYLSQHNNHLHSRSVLITQDVVSEHRAGVSESEGTITHRCLLRIYTQQVRASYLSPPMATPSKTPSVVREMMLLSSLDMPPERDT